MKLKNTTEWSDHFLRRMVSWCCKQIGMPARACRIAVFRNSRSCWGGAARDWQRKITVCVGAANQFPCSAETHEAGATFADRIECLVSVTAHELYHIAAHHSQEHRQATRGGRDGSSERLTCREEMRVLKLFRSNRQALLAEWLAAPVVKEKSAVSVQDKRADKAQADLDRWQRKLKLAQTKVRKLKQRVRYYEHTLAAKRSK